MREHAAAELMSQPAQRLTQGRARCSLVALGPEKSYHGVAPPKAVTARQCNVGQKRQALRLRDHRPNFAANGIAHVARPEDQHANTISRTLGHTRLPCQVAHRSRGTTRAEYCRRHLLYPAWI